MFMNTKCMALVVFGLLATTACKSDENVFGLLATTACKSDENTTSYEVSDTAMAQPVIFTVTGMS